MRLPQTVLTPAPLLRNASLTDSRTSRPGPCGFSPETTRPRRNGGPAPAG